MFVMHIVSVNNCNTEINISINFYSTFFSKLAEITASWQVTGHALLNTDFNIVHSHKTVWYNRWPHMLEVWGSSFNFLNLFWQLPIDLKFELGKILLYHKNHFIRFVIMFSSHGVILLFYIDTRILLCS